MNSKLNIKVVPGASKDEMAGWLGNSLKVRVRAVAEKGKANSAVESVIAGALGLAKDRVRIIKGKTSPRKVVQIEDMSHDAVIKRLLAENCVLLKTVSASGRPDFKRILKMEIEGLGMDCLHLQQGMGQSNFVSDDQYTAIILKVSDNPDHIIVKAGISYAGVVAGCHCADDPGPMNRNNEYCEIGLVIDKASAKAEITLLE